MKSRARIVEALLEALFFQPLRELFDEWAKDRGMKLLRIFKPSQQDEKFLGFDYAWASSEVGYRQYISDLSKAIRAGSSSVLYFGFFLQYKVGEPVLRLSAHPSLKSHKLPMCRFALDTIRDKKGNLSQHELLKRLSGLAGAQVYYSVPEIFSPDELPQRVELKMLRLFQVDQNSPLLNDNTPHNVYFKPSTDDAIWCSDPIPFKSNTAAVLAERIEPMSAEQFMDFLGETLNIMADRRPEPAFGDLLFPDSLRFVEFSSKAE